MAIKKLCPRCRKIIDVKEKHCEECTKFYKGRHKEYDSRFRDRKSKEFYSSREWQTEREIVLTYYGHVDLYQFIVNKRKVPANTVHHIEELKDNWNLRLSFDNLIPVSEASHMLIHKIYRTDKVAAQKLLRECIAVYRKLIGE